MHHIGPAGLKTYPWFMQQPEYKNLFDQASAIKEGKLTTMNKAGKAAVAKQFIAAGDAALARFQGEEGEGGFFGALTEYEETIQQQVLAVEREEAGPARRPPGGDDACCKQRVISGNELPAAAPQLPGTFAAPVFSKAVLAVEHNHQFILYSLVFSKAVLAVEHVAVGVGGPQLPLAVAEAQTVQAGRHAVGRGHRQHLQRLARHREHL
eukprot:scaffold38859_cov60-Phaeocystis_antarctica.AAC.1